MRPLYLIAVLWALSLALADRAAAAPKESPAYTQAVTLGLTEFEEKNFAEARAQFLRAHALSPSARTLRALGMVEFELKHYAESARLLSEALGSSEKPLDADKRKHAQQLLEQANSYIGKLTLDIEPETALNVDGVMTNLRPGSELVLEVGDHTLEFHAPTRIAQKRTLTIRGGEASTLRVRLAALKPGSEESAAKQAATSSPDAPKERRVVRNPWLWTAVGVVVAGAAAGAAIALTRDRQSSEKPYPGTGGAPVFETAR
jgi:tetratricopeptide (TPR) repeat protein